MGTLVMVALDRYRLVSWPHKPRLPPFLAVLTTWLLALCVVLPYAVYMKYIDLQQFLGPQFKGVGICAINMDDDISEYIRVLFITLFAVPLGVITFLHVRVSVVLRGLDPAASVSLPTRRESRSQDTQQEVWSLHDNRFFPSTMMTEMDSRDGFHYHDAAAVHQLSSSFYTPTPTTTSTTTAPPHTPTRSSSSRGARAGEAEMIVLAERRTQRYLVTIVTTFALCLSPLMILRLVKNMVLETTENSGHFDITFITFVWVAFLPTLTTPVFYAAWKMPRSTKNRLQGYLRFSQRSHSCNASHELSPMFYCHSRAAHRLSLQPALASTSPQHPRPTPVFTRHDHPRPHTLALPS